MHLPGNSALKGRGAPSINLILIITAGALMCAALFLSRGSFAAPAADKVPLGQTAPSRSDQRHELARDFGKLPLSFAVNMGQADRRVRFIARGPGYSLFLTGDEAVLALRSKTGVAEENAKTKKQETAASGDDAVVRMKLVGANRKAKIEGLDELPGKLNYFVGNDAGKWQANISTYSRVKYHRAYPGIDVVYHGNQQQLEYDFLIAPGASPRRIKMAFTRAQKITIDQNGDLLLHTADGEVRQHKPVAYQESNGERREVAVNYKLTGTDVSFETGAYDKTQQLIIDPVLVYSSYLGGASSEQGNGIAVDAQGSAYLTGTTASANFPNPGAFQGALSGPSDVFVVKLNPAGTALVYGTYLGGTSSEAGNSIAVDAQGSAYVVGSTGSSNFPVTPGAFQTAKDGSFGDAFASKLSPGGSSLVYSTYIGGENSEVAYGVAVDAGGRAYVVGTTFSTRFLTFPFPTPRNGNPAYKSVNGAGNWSASASGLTSSSVGTFAIDPANSNTIYATASLGVFKSIDAGAHWTLTGSDPTVTQLATVVAVDPSNSAIVYAGTSTGVYKSTDGGANYAPKNNGLGSFPSVRTLAIDPNTPTTLYVGPQSGIIYKSIDGGDNWVQIRNGIPGVPRVNRIVIDPTNTATVYLGSSAGMFKTTNGGTLWSAINTGLSSSANITAVVIDPLQPATLYLGAGVPLQAAYKTTNGGANWSPNATGLPFGSVRSLAIDPITPATIYAATFLGVFKSTNAGANWIQSNPGLANLLVNDVVIDRNNPATVYAGTSVGADAFAVRFNSTGTALEYLTNFGGAESDQPSGVAVQSDGSAYLVGVTNSPDFPVLNAFQSVFGGVEDAFVTKLNPSGSAMVYSTYLGGNQTDSGKSIAVRAGSAYVTGATFSPNFPTVNPIDSPPDNFNADVFVTKLNPSGMSLDFSTCLGGVGDDQGFGLALDSGGAVYITGSAGFGFPMVAAPQPSPGSPDDAFVTKINAGGSALVYSTYLGGSDGEQGNGIAVDASGDAYVVGTTFSPDFPTVSPFNPTLSFADAFVTKLGSSLDIGVTITDAPDPMLLGADLTYTITVKNNGELPATGVTLNDTLPAGATFVSVNTTRGTCSGTTSITCSLGTMNGAETATVQLVIKPPAVASISNTATATSNEVDPVPGNNTATAQTQVDFADLSVIVSTAVSRVAPTGRINYLLQVKNLSGKTANSVTLTDNLPVGTTFVSCSAPGGVCGGSGNNRTVTFASLAVGQVAPVVLVASVNSGVAEGTILNNTANVAAALPDPQPGNNSASAAVTVTATPFLKKQNGLLAFATGGVYTVKTDGSELPAPFPGATQAIIPRWSPDGAKLAYTISKTRSTFPFNTFTAIEVANAAGGGEIILADNASDTSFNNRSGFAWSPDGTRVVYVGSDKFIYLANTDGSGFVQLPNSPGNVRDIDWSADGTRFVFSKDFGEIYVMNVDGSGLTKLVALGTGPDGPTHYVGPVWSPDMTRILFSQVSNNDSDIFVMNSDGTGQQRFLNRSFTYAPAWSPDGSRVAFYNGPNVYVIDADGTNELRLTLGDLCCNFGSLSWQPIPTNTPLPPVGPPAPTFTISGRITNSNGTAAAALLKLSGSRTGLVGADAAGNYIIVNLSPGGTYTITPTSFFSKYTPASRTFSNLQHSETAADFVANSVGYTIKGRLTDTQGQGLGGQPIALNRFGSQTTTTTDSQGVYMFTNVFPGDGYLVIPSSPTFTFDPNSAFLGPVFSDMTVNFVGSPNDAVRSISGRLTDGMGQSLAGHPVSLSGARSVVVKTNTSGQFNFANLPTGLSYTLTPSTSGGFTFSPPQVVYPNLTGNQNAGFIASITQPAVQFSALSYTVGENGRSVQITVTRTGNLSASGAVDYQTSDITASERTDYTAVYGTLHFAPGEASRSFSVLVSDDVFVEGARTFAVTLSNGSGVNVGFPVPSATVIIADDDTVAATQNPIDDAAFFVRQHYADFLNRVPDDAGLNFWVNQITECGADAACREIRLINVSAAFFLSIEFQETGYLVYRVHGAAFGTAERLKLKAFLRDTQEIGRGVAVGVGDWQQQLEANKRAFMDEFVLRPEFTAVYPISMAPGQFVDMLNANTGSSLTSTERDALVSDLTSGAKSRAQVLRAVAENSEFSRRQSNRAFVLMQYFGYLRRNPDDAPDADFAGHAFWLAKLNEFNGNFVQADMVKSFLVAGEYRGRFGKP